MDRAFESGAIGIAPTVPAVPSVGFPTGGNPVGGVPATKPGAHWFHMVTEELRALIVAGGLTPSPLVVDQVLQSLPGALASRPEMARSLASNGYQRLPGGLILQWGVANLGPNLGTGVGSASVVGSVTFPIAFPTGCTSVTVNSFVPNSTGGEASENYVYVQGTSAVNFAVAATRVSGSGNAGEILSVIWKAIGF